MGKTSIDPLVYSALCKIENEEEKLALELA
jgi:hypothetical protein